MSLNASIDAGIYLAKDQQMERKVFTYKDVEEAKEWIGKGGVFHNNGLNVSRGFGLAGILVGADMLDEKGPFRCGTDNAYVSIPYQFFSPDPIPVEKWVPFTSEDWREVMSLFYVKKGDPRRTIYRPVAFSNMSAVFIEPLELRIVYVFTNHLLENYEQPDGTPCGKKVVG